MKAMLVSVVVLMAGLSAHAGIDVACTNGDCLSNGWDITEMNTGERSSVRCSNGDCQTDGWVSEYKDEQQNEVVCKPGGCFLEGWRVFDSNSGLQVADVYCYRGFNGRTDCLQNGWDTFSRQYGRYPTLCYNRDCARVGWETHYPNFPPQVTRCKAGGCFVDGWTVRP